MSDTLTGGAGRAPARPVDRPAAGARPRRAARRGTRWPHDDAPRPQLAEPASALTSAPRVEPPPSAASVPITQRRESITCPECGTVANVQLTRRESGDFCAKCDFPLFWTPATIQLGEGATDGAALRRLPGPAARDRRLPPCPHCHEANAIAKRPASGAACRWSSTRARRPSMVHTPPPPSPSRRDPVVDLRRRRPHGRAVHRARRLVRPHPGVTDGSPPRRRSAQQRHAAPTSPPVTPQVSRAATQVPTGRWASQRPSTSGRTAYDGSVARGARLGERRIDFTTPALVRGGPPTVWVPSPGGRRREAGARFL